jgi:hypothetical protein
MHIYNIININHNFQKKKKNRESYLWEIVTLFYAIEYNILAHTLTFQK